MKLRLFVLAAASVLATQALAEPIVFTTVLSGAFEEPPNASPGTGTATVTFDPDANTMRIETTFSGLLSNVTVSHIHVINGPGDTNTEDTVGPVATTVPSFPDFPAGGTSGSYDRTFDLTDAGTYNPTFVTNSGGSLAQAEFELFDALMDGRAYLNIHSEQFPAGEIRGFFTPVPEPATLAALGIGALAFMRRRRR